MRNSFIGKTSAAICLLGGALLLAPPAHATNVTCTGSNNPSPGSTVHGNLDVPANATCDLLGVTVTGNVTVGHDAILMMSNVTVNGTLTVKTPHFSISDSKINGATDFSAAKGVIEIDNLVGACGSTFGGPVTISNEYGATQTELKAQVQVTPPLIFGQNPENPGCGGNTVKSNVSILNNDLDIEFAMNRIGGGVEVNKNEGTITILGNVIGNGLSCAGNDDLALAGQGTNNVHGGESGQCKNF